MSVEGMSRAAIARVEHIDLHTVDRWLGRATAERFNDTMTRNILVQELQADELQAVASQQAQPTWVFTTLEVWSRFWVSTVVGARTAHNTKQLLQDTVTRGEIAEDCLVTTDGYRPYTRVIRDLLGDTCVYAQVVKTLRDNRVVKVVQKLIIGTPERLRQALFRSEDSTTVNTSFIERLNLTARQCCGYLGRRRLSHARGEEHLTEQLELVRCFYNFIRPHGALKFGKVIRTPAMQAGLVTRRLRFRDIFRSPAIPVIDVVNNT
jgi:IS1 family transposase